MTIVSRFRTIASAGCRALGVVALCSLTGLTVVSCSSGGGGGGAIAGNGVPAAPAVEASTQEETPVSLNLLAGASDPDGDPLTLVDVESPDPAQGTITFSANGDVTFTPSLDFFTSGAPIELSYRVADDEGAEVTSTLRITVVGVNDPPLASDDAATTDEDVAVDIDILGNDVDVDDDPGSLVIAITVAPLLGSVSVNPDQTIRYTPNPAVSGEDAFEYTITDSGSLSSAAEVVVTINSVNDPPLAAADSATTLGDTAVDIPVLDNDSDEEGDLLTLVGVVTAPRNGTAEVDPTGTFIVYTPNAGFCGQDAFQYSVDDGNQGLGLGDVTVNVCLDFTFEGDDQSISFDPAAGVVDRIVVPLRVREAMTNGGFPSALSGLTIAVEHDSSRLDPVQTLPSAALGALNGGLGPDVFEVNLSPSGLLVNVDVGANDTLSIPLPGGAIDVITVEYDACLRGQPADVTTQLVGSAGGLNVVRVDGVTAPAQFMDVSLEFRPTPPAAGSLNLYSVGPIVPFDPVTGTASDFTGRFFIQEGDASPPRAIDGFSLGVAHDPALISAHDVQLGEDLLAFQGGSGPDFFGFDVLPSGVVALVVIDFGKTPPVETLDASVPREILRVTYQAVPSGLQAIQRGARSLLEWRDDLGDPPVTNVVTIEAASQRPNLVSGEVCFTAQ